MDRSAPAWPETAVGRLLSCPGSEGGSTWQSGTGRL